MHGLELGLNMDDERKQERRQHEYVRVDLHIHSAGDAKVVAKLAEILTLLKLQGKTMANEFQDLEDKVTANTTVVDSLGAVIDGIKAKLDAAIAANDPAALKRLSDALGESNDQMAQWVIANTVAEDEASA